MAAWVNRRIWPNAFVCLQKVHRLSKADRAVRSKINTFHPDRQPALHIMPAIIVDKNVQKRIKWKWKSLILSKYPISVSMLNPSKQAPTVYLQCLIYLSTACILFLSRYSLNLSRCACCAYFFFLAQRYLRLPD